MKTNSKQKDRNYGLGVLLLLITIIMVGCVYLDSININQNTNPEEEPVYWVKAGEVATFTVKVTLRLLRMQQEDFLLPYWFLKVGMHVKIRR